MRGRQPVDSNIWLSVFYWILGKSLYITINDLLIVISSASGTRACPEGLRSAITNPLPN